MKGLFPIVSFDVISLPEANELLIRWEHKMGEFNRPNYGDALCHALYAEDVPVALTICSRLIPAQMGAGIEYLTRENTIELARLCACRPGLCRVALRLWREFVFPALPYEYAVSYQDTGLHTGNTYRFDGWQEVGRSRSGTDKRSGRKGRNKKIWQYPPVLLKQ
jgi:hypothetical protein